MPVSGPAGEDVDRLCHALVHSLTDLGRAVVEEQVEADPDAVALQHDGVEPREGGVAATQAVGRRGFSLCGRGGWRYGKGAELGGDGEGELLGQLAGMGKRG